MKIGIFGGSFNPPHKMHKTIALELIKKGYVDIVIYVPTGDSYIKKDLVAAYDRLEMLKLMIRDCSKLLVSDYEIKNGLRYTYQTLDYFKHTYHHDEIYFVCGSDNLKQLTLWKNYHYILSNYKLLVIKRDKDDIIKIIEKLGKANIIVTDITSRHISSTDIRKKMISQKEVEEIDPHVKAYIKKRKLYSDEYRK